MFGKNVQQFYKILAQSIALGSFSGSRTTCIKQNQIMINRQSKRPSSSVSELKEAFGSGKHVMVLTGVGVSSRCGIPTLHGSASFWKQHETMKLATTKQFYRLASSATTSTVTPNKDQIGVNLTIIKDTSTDFDIPPPPEPPLSVIENMEAKPEIIGAVIPWKMMPLLGKIIAPVSWTIMYYIHGLHELFPWWASIALATLTLRTLMLPIVIKSTSTTTKWMNILPKEMQLNKKMTDAIYASDVAETQHYKMKLKLLHKEHGVSQFQRLWPLMIQTPVFMSMFSILRTLAAHQETLKEGGLFWFKDLSVMDPTYILPIMTCSTLLISLELGAETGGATTISKPIRWALRCLPFGLFYLIYDFPAAMLCYWVVSNSFSLVQSLLLKNAFVRRKLNMPIAIKHDRAALGLDKSFSQMLKEFKQQSRSSQKPEEIRRLDRIAFEKAAIGPIQKTYKTDPTKNTRSFGKAM